MTRTAQPLHRPQTAQPPARITPDQEEHVEETQGLEPTRASALARLGRRLRPPTGWHDDRGDVPGWVLVTLMTAGLVIALWAIAGPALAEVFTSAIERVTSFNG